MSLRCGFAAAKALNIFKKIANFVSINIKQLLCKAQSNSLTMR